MSGFRCHETKCIRGLRTRILLLAVLVATCALYLLRDTYIAVRRSQPFLETLLPPEPLDNTTKSLLREIRGYSQQLRNTSEVSVITAYFNLGSLNKTGSDGQYTPELYKRWMATFGWMDNPLVVFTDTEETAQYFRQLRARYPASRTTVIVLNRDELWAFRLAEEIRVVFAQPGYPRHPPNTINPLYSCAMHAKFELVQRAVLQRLYQSRYVAWLDIGLFRDEAKKAQTIHLTTPDDFDRKKVAYSMVEEFQRLTPMEIVRQNKVWVGGASFLATPEVAFVYCSEYRRAVRKLLDMKIMSTDQQVIYSMYQPSFDLRPHVRLQLYSTGGTDDWFLLGYIMKGSP